MPFMVVDGCKILHNSSFDSMSHFVQDEFQSTNSEDKFRHTEYMSKHTHKRYPQHILQTHRQHSQNIKIKQTHMFTAYPILKLLRGQPTETRVSRLECAVERRNRGERQRLEDFDPTGPEHLVQGQPTEAGEQNAVNGEGHSGKATTRK